MIGLDPLVNYAAKLKYKSAGQLTAPMVVKATAGAKGQGPTHAQSLDSWLMNTPGLTVHADRGSAMKSDTLAQLLATLGVQRSFSRPHVSDNNAFSEAQFKTLKYQPDYPDRFASPTHGRAWCQEFFGWYNDHHHHSGLALFTPADVFYGRVEEVAAQRQVALDAAYAAHPERFPNGPPIVRRPPESVSATSGLVPSASSC